MADLRGRERERERERRYGSKAKGISNVCFENSKVFHFNGSDVLHWMVGIVSISA